MFCRLFSFVFCILLYKHVILQLWPCDIAVRITYLISHSSSLGYNTVIKRYFWVGCIINTKLLSCVDIIRLTSLVFPSLCPENTHLRTNLMMYGGLCQHTRVVFYIYNTLS